jgi:hypothetical protein
MGNNKPIVPLFSGKNQNKSEAKGNCYEMAKSGKILIYNTDSHLAERCDPNTLKMSLDGERFYSMERIEELIELGLQYEYAIESLAVENDDEQRN